MWSYVKCETVDSPQAFKKLKTDATPTKRKAAQNTSRDRSVNTSDKNKKERGYTCLT